MRTLELAQPGHNKTEAWVEKLIYLVLGGGGAVIAHAAKLI